MANCTDVRIDHQNLNTSGAGVDPAQAIYDSARGKIYWVYADQSDVFAGLSLLKNHSVFFREQDATTGAFGIPVNIVTTATGAAGYDYPCFVRLTSGRLIVLYRYTTIATDPDQPGLRCEAKESNDNGLTWSAAVTVFATTSSGGNPYALATDGTNVWAWGWRNGAPKDLVFNKRTGVGTWGGESVIFNGGAADTYENMELGSARPVAMVFSATVGFFCGLRYANTVNDVKMTCLRTTDGSSFTEIILKDYGNDPSNVIVDGPRVFQGADGTIRCMWLETNGAGSYKPVFSISDDNGATWTLIGNPALIETDSTQYIGGPVGWGFQIDPSNRLYFSGFYSVAGVNVFRIYRSNTDSTTGWEMVHECTYVGNTLSSSARNSTVFAGYKYYHAFQNQISYLMLSLLTDDFEEPGGGPGPSPPSPSPTGADENNIYIRKVLGPKSGGWSVHTKAVSCWMAWDEGDFDTGREVPIVTAGAEVWPTIQDPALVGIINRIEAPDLYADRHNTFNQVVYDPLTVEIASKQYEVAGPGDIVLLRGATFEYMRNGAPFEVELWIDDQLNSTHVFENTAGEVKRRFCPARRYNNTGTNIWYRILEESVEPFEIHSFRPFFKKKGRRGRDA